MSAVDDALNSSRRAVEFDRGGFCDAAAYYYRVAARLLEQAYVELPEDSSREAWQEKAREYKERADVIQAQAQEETPAAPPPNPSQVRLLRCRFLLSHALDADEAGQRDTAVRLYTQAIEMSLAAKGETSDPELQGKLMAMARQALERAEQLKGIKRKLASVSESTPVGPSSPLSDRPRTEVASQASSAKPGLHRGSSGHLKVSGKATYTDEEKRVLLATSRINQHDYVPFMTIDLGERFQYAIPFTDSDGPLALSPKQRRDFARWARPEEFCSEPRMVANQQVDYYSIKQTVVSDCSFVASLAVSALYEKRFARCLITSIIYPRNRDKKPVYNPFGKYMVKLHLNGVPRKVIIDDQLPVDKHGRLLCSYSTNRDELWISLLEKAYMKVMGGYDFPGSNSNIDLHALSGWVPERMAIRPGDPQFDSEALFNSLLTRLHKGDVLITVATGELTDAQADRTGLVPTHAYAVLDIRLVKGVQLLKLKNPWSHVRWRGNYSELDAAHWKAELCRVLDYDPDSAAAFDNGIFWIDYASILRFYDVFYLNWNPALFSHTYCIHQSWSAGAGPVKDAYNIGDNPQFRLETGGSASGAIWILLTRHITLIDDFRENTEYITVLVYCNDGKRVYYPNDPPPYMDGVRINSPHYLCKILLSDTPVRRFTLVVSQYEKTRTIYYTLRAYATAPFTLDKLTNPYTHFKQVSDEWRGASAGGCRNHPATYPNNPRFEVTIASPYNNAALLIDLKGPKQYQMGVEVTVISLADDSITAPFTSKSSGPFRSGFVVLELEELPGGVYAIIPSTYLPGQEGPFFLTVKASCTLQLTRVS